MRSVRQATWGHVGACGLLVLLAFSVGCQGEAMMSLQAVAGGSTPDILGGALPAPPLDNSGRPICDLSLYGSTGLDQIAADFTTNIYPLLVRAQGGCTSCHAAGSGRLFLVTDDAVATFH